MRRGDVCWSHQPEPIGRRPVVLLSRDVAYSVRNAITVAQVTTSVHRIPVEVPLGPEDGLPQRCVVNLDTVTTIPKRCIQEFITHLSQEKIKAIEQALKFALDL